MWKCVQDTWLYRSERTACNPLAEPQPSNAKQPVALGSWVLRPEAEPRSPAAGPVAVVLKDPLPFAAQAPG